jgi:hypothetical protein
MSSVLVLAMPGKDVDGTSLSEHVETVLELDLPAGAVEDSYDQLDKRGMGSVDEPIGKPTPVADLDDEGRSKRGGDSLH